MKVIVCQQDGLECDLDIIVKKCRHIKDWEGRCSFRREKKASKEQASVKRSESKAKSKPPELYPELVTKCPRCGFVIVEEKA